MILPLLLLARVLLPAAPAFAGGSFGGDFTTGQGYRGFDVKGSADLDAKGEYDLNAMYSHVESNVGTDTRSNQAVIGADHSVEDVENFHGSMSAWKDDISDVKYLGPSFGFDYTFYRDGAGSGADGSRSSEDQQLVVVYNSDLFFYETGVNSSSTSFTQGFGRSAHKIVVPPLNSSINMFQFHPTIELDLPLFKGKVVPSIAAGHDFYSKDPTLIEQRSGLPLFAQSAAGLSGLAGGLFYNNAQIGLDLRLPADVRLRGTLGVEQAVADYSWATVQGLTLSRVFFDQVKGSFSWNRTIQGGVPQDLVTFGLTWLY